MKKLQTLLRKTSDIHVSLQDPRVLEKLLAAGAQSDDEQVLTLVCALRHAHILPLESQHWPSVSETERNEDTVYQNDSMLEGTIPGLKKQTRETLDAQVCALLADYCGPISGFLFKQSWRQLACHDIYEDFDRLIDRLSSEIPDQGERVEFVEKCQRLV